MSKTFTVENYKGVNRIELSPSGNLVVIAGGNGAGKSSFIDAITELFDPRGKKLTPKPLRDGTERATAEYVDEDLGLRISRTWTKDGTAGTLTVEALDGARYQKPADVVAQLTGGAVWDPVAWLNLSERDQREELLAKVDLPFDITALAAQKSDMEDRRRSIGREVKRLQGALASMPEVGHDVPDDEVSAQALLDRIQDAQAIERQRITAEYEVGRALEAVERAERALEHAKTLLRDAEADASQVPAQDDDIDALRAELTRVDDTNQAVRAKRQRADVAQALRAEEENYEAAQRELDRIEEQKRNGLAEANFPIDGLSVDEEGVTFDGIPFSQVNSAHRTRVAFAIATAGDPKLKLVIVRNGDLLDTESLQALSDMADARGYTVLIERDRDESRAIGFTIRDGEIEGTPAA